MMFCYSLAVIGFGADERGLWTGRDMTDRDEDRKKERVWVLQPRRY